jgi:hypothetical protein
MFKKFIALLLAGLPFFSVAQIVQWAQCFDPGTTINFGSNCSDASGNSYVIGTYEQDFVIDTVNVTHFDGKDVYIAKFDPSGTAVWVTSLASSGDDYGNSITVDLTGNVYVTGSYASGFTMGTIYPCISCQRQYVSGEIGCSWRCRMGEDK